MEAIASVDADGYVVDGQEAAPHVVKEGDCYHQCSAPLPWAGEQDARWHGVCLHCRHWEAVESHCQVAEVVDAATDGECVDEVQE